MDRDMLPLFRADDYAGGIAKGAEAVITTLAHPFAARATPAPVQPGPGPHESGQPESGLISALVIVGGVVAVILICLLYTSRCV